MAESHIDVGGHRIKVGNLDKVLYPKTGTTKGEVMAYYAAVAAPLVEHARDRPVSRHRWPNGVEKPGFWEKDLPSHAPQWLPTVTLAHSDRDVTYPLLDSAATLIWLSQSAALELHVPQWRVRDAGGLRRKANERRVAPDRIVIDLDPGPPAGLAECAEVALLVRAVVADAGFQPAVVTSGSKGMQLYFRTDGLPVGQSTSEYAKALAVSLAKERPDLVLSSMNRADRKGKVLLDWSQNNPAKTTVTPYSLRGREIPTVAAPRDWAEVEAGDLVQLHYDEVVERLDVDGDLFDLG